MAARREVFAVLAGLVVFIVVIALMSAPGRKTKSDFLRSAGLGVSRDAGWDLSGDEAPNSFLETASSQSLAPVQKKSNFGLFPSVSSGISAMMDDTLVNLDTKQVKVQKFAHNRASRPQPGAPVLPLAPGGDARRPGEFDVDLKPPKTILSQDSGVITISNSLGIKDAGFVCSTYDMVAMGMTTSRQVVQITPHVTYASHRQQVESIVHHMDVFMCTDDSIIALLDQNADDPSFCASAAFVGKGGPCHEMPYAYDRGSLPFVFPDNAGWRIGPGTPYTTMVLAVHYLLPEWWDNEGE